MKFTITGNAVAKARTSATGWASWIPLAPIVYVRIYIIGIKYNPLLIIDRNVAHARCPVLCNVILDNTISGLRTNAMH